MIDITGVDLIKFAQKVYELSVQQETGFLHAESCGLSAGDAESLIETNVRCPLSMDYVRGRACKMTVYWKDDKLLINNSWYDHTDSQFKELLETFNIKIQKETKHSMACNCVDCQG